MWAGKWEHVQLPYTAVVLLPQGTLERVVEGCINALASFSFYGPTIVNGDTQYSIRLKDPPRITHRSDDGEYGFTMPDPMIDPRVCELTIRPEGTTTSLSIENPGHHSRTSEFLALFVEEMQQRGMSLSGDVPKKTQRTRRGPNSDTQTKLESLRAIRKRPRSNRPTWNRACQEAGIEHRTAERHVPDLQEHWNDPD